MCIGTISDIVPLVDENRVIAKLGLMLVSQTRNIGLRSIINSSGYTKIDSGSVSFGIAPRINACGRMGKAEELGFAIATIADARNGYLSGVDVLIDGGASTGKKFKN